MVHFESAAAYNVNLDEEVQQHLVQYFQHDTPQQKQSLKTRLISDRHSEDSNAIDDAPSIEGKICTKVKIASLKFYVTR